VADGPAQELLGQMAHKRERQQPAVLVVLLQPDRPHLEIMLRLRQHMPNHLLDPRLAVARGRVHHQHDLDRLKEHTCRLVVLVEVHHHHPDRDMLSPPVMPEQRTSRLAAGDHHVLVVSAALARIEMIDLLMRVSSSSSKVSSVYEVRSKDWFTAGVVRLRIAWMTSAWV